MNQLKYKSFGFISSDLVSFTSFLKLLRPLYGNTSLCKVVHPLWDGTINVDETCYKNLSQRVFIRIHIIQRSYNIAQLQALGSHSIGIYWIFLIIQRKWMNYDSDPAWFRVISPNQLLKVEISIVDWVRRIESVGQSGVAVIRTAIVVF